MRRGELYRVRKPGRDPRQHRVFLIVSRQVLIDSKFSTVICAPVFSHGEGLATQVAVGVEEGLKRPSWVTCDTLVSLRKGDLSDYVGALPPAKLVMLARALRVALDLP